MLALRELSSRSFLTSRSVLVPLSDEDSEASVNLGKVISREILELGGPIQYRHDLGRTLRDVAGKFSIV